MTLTTLAGVLAGQQPRQQVTKVSGGNIALPTSLWLRGGRPVAQAAPSMGLNGANLTGGGIRRVNPASGEAIISEFSGSIQSGNTGTGGVIMLCDRLWHNSGLSPTSITAQAISMGALPARDGNLSTNGLDVMAAVETYTSMGAGAGNATLTYTDADGNTGKTAVRAYAASQPVASLEIFDFSDPDTRGVRAITSFIQSVSRTSGAQGLVLFRILAMLNVNHHGVFGYEDALSLCATRIPDDAHLWPIYAPNSSGSYAFIARYREAHG